MLNTYPEAEPAADLGFPWWLQVTHFVNFLFLGLLVRSAWEILASHPRLYWRKDCGPGTEWLRFTKDQVPSEVGAFTARDDQRTLHPLVSLPGRARIGIGRAWHGLVTPLWVLNGLIYVVLLFATLQWRRLGVDDYLRGLRRPVDRAFPALRRPAAVHVLLRRHRARAAGDPHRSGDVAGGRGPLPPVPQALRRPAGGAVAPLHRNGDLRGLRRHACRAGLRGLPGAQPGAHDDG
jgi:hypothetical protein